jgi:DNA-binding Lrp family transcriptional regulator
MSMAKAPPSLDNAREWRQQKANDVLRFAKRLGNMRGWSGAVLGALDDLDRRLIQALRDNARLPTVTLARILGVSRGTVQNRIDRLVESGTLLGFTVRLRGEGDLGGVRAITTVEVRAADTRAVITALKRMPDVTRIHSTNGRWDLVLEVNAPDLAALDRALHEIRAIRGVSLSETSILLSEVG